jgi:Mce-associated membrane protein
VETKTDTAVSHETADEEIPADLAEKESTRAPRPGALEWLTSHIRSIVVGMIVVVMVGGLAQTTILLRHRDAVDSARTSALTAAKKYAVELASYDYRHLDQDFGLVLANSTPSFRTSFTQSSTALKTVLTKYDATAKASVVAAGMVSANTHLAVALLFINQTVTNTTQKGQPTSDESRLEITLLRSHGKWLINQVKLL